MHPNMLGALAVELAQRFLLTHTAVDNAITSNAIFYRATSTISVDLTRFAA